MEQLGKHFKAIAGPLLTRNGFAFGELLAAWEEILGPELARHCVPEKLSFPKGLKTGGTLLIRARFGRALDVQYAAPRLIEQLNRFCGYEAVAMVKVIQGALPEAPRKPGPPPEPAAGQKAQLEAELAGIGEPRLKAALERLGKAAMARRAKPQS